MPIFTQLFLAVLILIAGIAYSVICNDSGSIRINGSGTALDIMKPLLKVSRRVSTFVGIEMERPLAYGTYPRAKEISFVTTSKSNPATPKLISFICSPKGRAIAEHAEVPVTTEPVVAGH